MTGVSYVTLVYLNDGTHTSVVSEDGARIAIPVDQPRKS